MGRELAMGDVRSRPADQLDFRNSISGVKRLAKAEAALKRERFPEALEVPSRGGRTGGRENAGAFSQRLEGFKRRRSV
jgi:hypothetical protein